MLSYENQKWYWNERSYDTFREAFESMCEDITWNSVTPTFGNVTGDKLTSLDRKQLLLLRAIYEYDLAAVIMSRDVNEYQLNTRSKCDPFLREYLSPNPLYCRNVAIPMSYERVDAMQVAVVPGLKHKHGEVGRRIKTKHGKYAYGDVLSFICDSVLFDPKTTPFKKALEMYIELDAHEQTRGLDKYLSHEDLSRAYVLSLQAHAGDLTGEETITPSMLRRSDYACKTVDELYGRKDYYDVLMSLPPAMHSNNYYDWLDAAMSASGVSLKKEEKETPAASEDVHVAHDDEPLFDSNRRTQAEKTVGAISNEGWKKMQVDWKSYSDNPELYSGTVVEPMVRKWAVDHEYVAENIVMRDSAKAYCETLGFDYEVVLEEMRRVGITEWEAVYRALPVYLRKRKQINVEALTKYCTALKSEYGDCELRM